MPELFTLIVLCSIGIIGIIQWVKELIKSIRNNNKSSLFNIIMSFVLSLVSGFLIWKIKYNTLSFYMMFPLALGVLSVVQLGYDNIIKYLSETIEAVMKRFLVNEQSK